ncbi:hypothetical protein Tco_0621394, partial [Tanacetum coccineum]
MAVRPAGQSAARRHPDHCHLVERFGGGAAVGAPGRPGTQHQCGRFERLDLPGRT